MKEFKPTRHLTGVLIAMPTFRANVAAQTMQSVYNVGRFLSSRNIPNAFSWIAASEIAEVRNIILTSWYDQHQQFSHLLFVDDDMEFPTELIIDMLNFGKPLMGTIYAKRKWPAEAVGRAFKEQNIDDIVDGFVKFQGCGFGVTMIHRHVVRTMLDKMPELVDEKISGHPGQDAVQAKERLIRAFDPFFDERGVRLSEDFAFCERWNKCGGEVWCNVDHMVGHIGTYNHAIRYADYLENKAREAKEAA